MSRNLNQMGFKNMWHVPTDRKHCASSIRITIHAVITDLEHAVMTGLELTKAIRADAKLANCDINGDC